MKEEYHFWSMVHYFIKEQNYRILHMSKEQKELWLENPDSKKAPIIRLFNCVLDWSSWLERDLQLTGMNGERIRKQKFLKSIHIVNIYISPYPPIDDYENRIQKLGQFDHTQIETMIMSRDSVKEVLSHLQNKFHSIITIPMLGEEEITSELIEDLKKKSLQISIKRDQEDKNVFNFGKPFITYVLIAIHFILFFLLESNGGSENPSTLVDFGAKFNPLIIAGEWWRFISPMFLHIGFLHLIMNTLGLYYLGTAVEKIYGNARFFWIYLFAGVIGSIASFGFSPNLSAGASGAIYGCFGALLYIGVVYPKLFFRTLGKNLITILILNIVISVTVPQIDLAGHLGGLIGGFVATGMVHFPKKKKYLSQFSFLLIAFALTASLLFYGFTRPVQFQSEDSVLQLSQEYVKEEEYEKSFTLLKNYGKHSSNLSESFYFQLSYVEIQLDKLKEAETNLKRAIVINPNFHEAHFNLALILFQQQYYDKAEQHVRKAIEIDPNNEKYQELLREMN
jgi:rhomboid protease GluP